MFKTPSKAILVNEPGGSDWKFGAIKNDLTTLTPLIMEDSTKQFAVTSPSKYVGKSNSGIVF